MSAAALSPEAKRYLHDLRTLSPEELSAKRARDDRNDRRTKACDRRNGLLLLVTKTRRL